MDISVICHFELRQWKDIAVSSCPFFSLVTHETVKSSKDVLTKSILFPIYFRGVASVVEMSK